MHGSDGENQQVSTIWCATQISLTWKSDTELSSLTLSQVWLKRIVGPWRKFCARLSLILVFVFMFVACFLSSKRRRWSTVSLRCVKPWWRLLTRSHRPAYNLLVIMLHFCGWDQNLITDKTKQILNTTGSFSCASFAMFDYTQTCSWICLTVSDLNVLESKISAVN